MTAFVDMGDFSEDERIQTIGRTVENAGGIVGFVVEDDAKADRYIKKLVKAHAVHVVDRGAGPVKGTVLVRIARGRVS